METQVFKKTSLTLTSFLVVALAVLGVYNTAVVNNDPFATTAELKFVKRLDEISGKISVGRLAASAASWVNLAKKEVPVKKEVAKVSKAQTQVVREVVPAPAISENLNLTLNKAFFKEPLREGTFAGSARTVNGVIEEVNVTLPTGQMIQINTREKMIGNVFTYEDSYTREPRSGMFYEVKKGTYMITLTNDTQFAGTRLEFVAENDAEVRYADEYYEENIGWGVQAEDANSEYAASRAEVEREIQPASYGFNFNG